MEAEGHYKVLLKLKAEGRKAFIRTESMFCSGEILFLSEASVTIADRQMGMVSITLSDITEAREWKIYMGGV